MNHLFVIMAALALSASWPLSAVPESPLINDLSKSSSPSATPANEVFVKNGPAPETYGLADNTWYVAGAWDALPIDSTFTYAYSNSVNGGEGIYRTNASGSPWVHIPVHLPNGALWTKIETNYCDTGAGNMQAFIFVQPKNGSTSTTSFLVSSGTPGCVVETATLGSAITIDNNANSYLIEVYFSVADSTLILGSMRMGYQLQVSPAPGVASFTDVPTSYWAFQYIEALKASGITQGVTPTTYEPESPVTRAQMAVFLAKALGLHFPN